MVTTVLQRADQDDGGAETTPSAWDTTSAATSPRNIPRASKAPAPSSSRDRVLPVRRPVAGGCHDFGPSNLGQRSGYVSIGTAFALSRPPGSAGWRAPSMPSSHSRATRFASRPADCAASGKRSRPPASGALTAPVDRAATLGRDRQTAELRVRAGGRRGEAGGHLVEVLDQAPWAPNRLGRLSADWSAAARHPDRVRRARARLDGPDLRGAEPSREPPP